MASEAASSRLLLPQTELEKLQLSSRRVTDDSLESTRRMVSLCRNSEDAGNRTIAMLADQGDELDQIEGGMDRIKADVREAEENLTRMRTCFGLCLLPCRRVASLKGDAVPWGGQEGGGEVLEDQPRRRDGRRSPGAGYVTRITDDAREDEMEDNLSQVGGILGNLRDMAVDMSSVLGGQNDQIDRIALKSLSNETRISLANRSAHQLLK